MRYCRWFGALPVVFFLLVHPHAFSHQCTEIFNISESTRAERLAKELTSSEIQEAREIFNSIGEILSFGGNGYTRDSLEVLFLGALKHPGMPKKLNAIYDLCDLPQTDALDNVIRARLEGLSKGETRVSSVLESFVTGEFKEFYEFIGTGNSFDDPLYAGPGRNFSLTRQFEGKQRTPISAEEMTTLLETAEINTRFLGEMTFQDVPVLLGKTYDITRSNFGVFEVTIKKPSAEVSRFIFTLKLKLNDDTASLRTLTWDQLIGLEIENIKAIDHKDEAIAGNGFNVTPHISRPYLTLVSQSGRLPKSPLWTEVPKNILVTQTARTKFEDSEKTLSDVTGDLAEVFVAMTQSGRADERITFRPIVDDVQVSDLPVQIHLKEQRTGVQIYEQHFPIGPRISRNSVFLTVRITRKVIDGEIEVKVIRQNLWQHIRSLGTEKYADTWSGTYRFVRPNSD